MYNCFKFSDDDTVSHSNNQLYLISEKISKKYGMRGGVVPFANVSCSELVLPKL